MSLESGLTALRIKPGVPVTATSGGGGGDVTTAQLDAAVAALVTTAQLNSATAALAASTAGSWPALENGLVNDATTDNTAAFKALSDTIVAAGGGTIWFAPGEYRLTGLVDITGPVKIQGLGWGDPDAQLTQPEQATTIISMSGASAGIRYKAATLTEAIHGGGIDGVMLDGRNSANILLEIQSTWGFQGGSVFMRRPAPGGVGLFINDGNHQLAAYNDFEYLKFRKGTAGESTGVVIGTVLTGGDYDAVNGTTTHTTGRVWDVESCWIGEHDQGKVDYLKVQRASGTTDGLWLWGDQSTMRGVLQQRPARKNRFDNVMGDVFCGPKSRNSIGYMQSEASSVFETNLAGVKITRVNGYNKQNFVLDYNVADRTTGAVYEMPRFVMWAQHKLGLTDTTHGGGIGTVVGGALVPALKLDTGDSFKDSFIAPLTWPNGKITELDVRYNSTTVTSNVTIDVWCHNADGSVAKATTATTVDLAASVASNTISSARISLTAATFTRGDLVHVRLTHNSGDAELELYAASVYFQANGPPTDGEWALSGTVLA